MAAKKKKPAKKGSKKSKAKKSKPKKAARKSKYVPFKVLKARAAKLQRIVDYREGKAKFA